MISASKVGCDIWYWNVINDINAEFESARLGAQRKIHGCSETGHMERRKEKKRMQRSGRNDWLWWTLQGTTKREVFLQKCSQKLYFQIYFQLYTTRVCFQAKYVRLHLKVKLHYAHISSLIYLVFIGLLVKVPVAGYLGFQLVNITSVSLRCHLHKGIQLPSYADILYQASFSHPSYPPVYA